MRPSVLALLALGPVQLPHVWGTHTVQPPVWDPTGCANLVVDCGAAADNQTDDSSAFQVCQGMAHGTGAHSTHGKMRGCVYAPPGNYRIADVPLNVSHTVYYFDNGATFWPAEKMQDTGSEQVMFRLGTRYNKISVQLLTNVSIIGKAQGYFTVDVSVALTPVWKAKAFGLYGWVDGFVIANGYLKQSAPHRSNDTLYPTQMSAITSDQSHDANGTVRNPTNGYVVNITADGGNWGYGAVQIRSGENITFESIDGTGGVAVRLESGGLGDEYIGGITVKNVTCRDGHAALMLEPHTQRNGVVHATDIRSYDCGMTLEINGGYEQEGKPPGWFSNASTISGVTSYYGRPGFAEWNKTKWNATACAAWVSANTNWNYYPTVQNVQAIGYPAPSNRTTHVYWKRWLACPFDTKA